MPIIIIRRSGLSKKNGLNAKNAFKSGTQKLAA